MSEEKEQLKQEAKEIAAAIFGVDVIHIRDDGSFFKTGPFMDQMKKDVQAMREKLDAEILKELLK